MYDFLIVGGGVFGTTAAVELAKRKYKVGLINPDTIPHHLAASTDITKVVRMEYGSDMEYFNMVELCIDRWHEWNELFQETLYHQVGYLMLCRNALTDEIQGYEKYSYDTLLKAGYPPDRLGPQAIKNRFPAINSDVYIDANYNPIGGYVESGKVVGKLAAYARSLGVDIHEGQTAEHFVIDKGKLEAVKTKEGNIYPCGHAIVAAGAHTPYLLPELQPYMKSSGHPVFWLKPKDPKLFMPPQFSVFTADISNSGWYGFPFLAELGVVKIAKHTVGLSVHPDKDDRHITDAEVKEMRAFVEMTFPPLADTPLVYTRRCLYTDTLDGHFWIDKHPAIKNLSVSSGGSGHAMKMAPLLGEMTADVVEGSSHQFSPRHRWRHLTAHTEQVEEARFIKDRKL